MPKRLDAEDTIDTALVTIRALQVAGWGVDSVNHQVEYAQLKPGGKKLPVGAVLTIRLIPAR